MAVQLRGGGTLHHPPGSQGGPHCPRWGHQGGLQGGQRVNPDVPSIHAYPCIVKAVFLAVEATSGKTGRGSGDRGQASGPHVSTEIQKQAWKLVGFHSGKHPAHMSQRLDSYCHCHCQSYKTWFPLQTSQFDWSRQRHPACLYKHDHNGL